MDIFAFLFMSSVSLVFLSDFSYATDSITQSQSLRDNMTLVSKNGRFELGFFNPGSSKNRYLGIWYKNIPVKTVVWVANRLNPINDSSGLLMINSTGSVVLMRNSLWESFDYPSDTLLPGMKMGWDLRNGIRSGVYTAWKNPDDPSPGDLTYGIEMKPNSYPEAYHEESDFVNNEDEVYYIYNLRNKSISEVGSGCAMWFGDLVDIRQFPAGGQDLYIRMSASEIPASSIKTKRNRIIGPQNNEGQNEDLELPFLDLSTIASATDNFAMNNKLGEGGFGPVYKGILEDGQEIAVKRLSRSSGQGLNEFKNEVRLIAKLQHRNLVKLLACCIQGEEKMLVYEYMPNRSLDSFIFDFGMARTFGGDQLEGNTNRVVGTYGYMAPEYAFDGQFSTKSDVFSFGILLLEIISGMRSRGFYHPNHSHNLIGQAWILWNEGRPLELVDECLGNSCTLSELLRCIHLSLLCVQQRPEDRPSMSSVVVILGSESALPQPKKPGFFLEKDSNEGPGFSSKHELSSTNEITITLLEAR
uniref:non-specific serine/threonine protein kinase n=1 Tax=Fagus sylvatica TaxID=28930 RepID=A0A2N9F8P9_FAGSY